MDEDVGPLSKCDPMLSSPDTTATNHNPLQQQHQHQLILPGFGSGRSTTSTAALHRGGSVGHASSGSSSSCSGSSSSRCSSVENLDGLGEGLATPPALENNSSSREPLTRGRVAAGSGRPAGRGRGSSTASAVTVKRLERGTAVGAERTENGGGRTDVYLGSRGRIPVVTRTSIITSTGSAAATAAATMAVYPTAGAASPSPFSMIFPLPEEISQLTEEFLPSASTTPFPHHHHHPHYHHPLLDDSGQNIGGALSPAAATLASPKQVSLEIVPGSCLAAQHHQDLGSFFVATSSTGGDSSRVVTTTDQLSCSTETLAERCLSLDDLRNTTTTTVEVTSSNVTGGGVLFQRQPSIGAPTAATAAARAATVTTYAVQPLVGGSCTQKKVILEERPITPSHHNDKVYLHL